MHCMVISVSPCADEAVSGVRELQAVHTERTYSELPYLEVPSVACESGSESVQLLLLLPVGAPILSICPTPLKVSTYPWITAAIQG